ncbi:MAG: hypothetical protein LBC84_04735 [Prevotellaceae bacterium]|jgi:MraZ protein|nr:hypothetical protein [Prevotellaceae bacterium]
MFIGTHIVKLDDKGRLVFPSSLKAQAEREGAEKLSFVVKKIVDLDSLEIVTLQVWERKIRAILKTLNTDFNPKAKTWWRGYHRDCAQVEPDEKMGRILIPKHLLEKIGVTKEVVFVGIGNKIEVWAKERYDAIDVVDSEHAALEEELLGNIILDFS